MDATLTAASGSAIDDIAARIEGFIGGSAQRAVFVAELATLAPPQPDRSAAIDSALIALEERGRLLVRAHTCGDPHLNRIDLRVAVLVDDVALDGGDRIQEAVRRDQAIWNDWIAEFLRSHRCQ